MTTSAPAGAETLGVCLERVLPAARALRAGGVFDLDGKLAADGQLDLGDNEQVGERRGVLVREEHIASGTVRCTSASRLLPMTFAARALLERAVDGGADLDDVLPARHGLGVERVGSEGLVHDVEQHVARVVLGRCGMASQISSQVKARMGAKSLARVESVR